MLSSFSEQLWIDFDLEIEFFLRNLVGWLRYNAGKDNPDQRNFHEGKYWSYNSYPEFSKILPGFTPKTIRTIIARCIKHGLLVAGNFNKKKYDNTNWYTLTEKGWTYFPFEASKLYPASSGDLTAPGKDLDTPAQTGRPPAQTGRPIPKKHNSLGSNINITISDIVETYHEELPELPKVKKVDSKLRTQLTKMVKDWPSYQKEGKEFTIQSFRDYLRVLKEHYGWFLKPYKTESGSTVKCTLRKLTREINITKVVNGEFSAD